MCLPNINVHLHLILNLPSIVFTKLISVFLISNFRRVLNVVCFLLGNSPASEVYLPTFRNTLFHLHRQVGVCSHAYLPMKMEHT
jgi:hypothetical protein